MAYPDPEVPADRVRWQGSTFNSEDAGIDRILESLASGVDLRECPAPAVFGAGLAVLNSEGGRS